MDCTEILTRYSSIIAPIMLTTSFFRLKLRALHRFSSTAAAVEELTAVQEGKLPKALKTFLNKEVVERGKGKEVLAVAETKLGQ